MNKGRRQWLNPSFQDIRRLNILNADDYPRVTEHIPAIHQLIQALEQQGYAYAVDGDAQQT